MSDRSGKPQAPHQLARPPARRSGWSWRWRPRPGWRAVLLAIAALAVLTRLVGLTLHYIWYDESVLLALGQKSLTEWLDWGHTHPGTFIKAPLIVFALGRWVALFGTSEWALRLPFALLGAATVPLLAVLCRPLIGPVAALVAALLLAVHPVHVYYSQQVSEYGPLLLVATLSMAAWLRLRRATAPPAWWAAVVATLNLSLPMIHPTGATIAALQLGDHLLHGGRSRPARWVATFNAVLLVAAGALTMVMLLQPPLQAALDWIAPASLPRVTAILRFLGCGVLSHGDLIDAPPQLWWTAVAAALVWGATALGAASRWRAPAAPHRNRRLLLAWLAAPVLLVVGTSLAARPLMVPRYTALALLPLCALAGRGLSLLGARQRLLGRLSQAALPLLLVAAVGVSHSLPGLSMRELAADLSARWRPGDALLASPEQAIVSLHYYLHHDMRDRLTGDRPGDDRLQLPRTVPGERFLATPANRRWLRTHARIWVVTMDGWPGDLATTSALRLLRRMRAVQMVRSYPFAGAQLLLARARPRRPAGRPAPRAGQRSSSRSR